MINFFRKIRQKLLTENPPSGSARSGKFTKYLIYALGEIVLVMIGILLALQVNNWNQWQKNEELSKLYFEDFISEVNSDISNLKYRIDRNQEMIQNISSILSTLATKKGLSESELAFFAEQHIVLANESYFIPETSSFRQLESNGHGSLIKNKELRDKLYQYYTLNDRNEKNGEISTQLYQHNYITKDLFRNLISGDWLQLNIGTTLNRSKLDLETLRQDSDYLFALILKRSLCENQNIHYETIKSKAEELVNLLAPK